MKFPFIFALLYPLLLAGVANAVERKLPTDIQVDLLFPRNETYAPTQQFPIVFGMNNIDDAWPLELRLYIEVRSIGMPGSSNQSSRTTSTGVYSPNFSDQFNQAPLKQFFHFPRTNITNGTTDSYIILWDFVISRQCFTNSTGSAEYLDWIYNPKYRSVEFSTAPGAKLPDIEAAVNSCPEPNWNNSAAVRVANVTSPPYKQGICPIFAIKPEKCVFKSAAKELAANVSAATLQDMRCDEGDWRTITAPCPPKSEESTALRQSVGSGVGWLLLALAFAILNDL
ncbi:hypothetical protein V502_04415 [Pseudogymnoascus sp. VKM F-4520 (FW-2644)]|nr:hypothetical protein V502_04415 [Pseudogymnoascus sp. VKM F-4520 (FW-2644)]